MILARRVGKEFKSSAVDRYDHAVAKLHGGNRAGRGQRREPLRGSVKRRLGTGTTVPRIAPSRSIR